MPSATAQAPAPIPSRIIKAVEFEDFGNVYRVDIESGKVTKTRVVDVQPFPPGPSPQPTPTPNPIPTPVAGKPGWVLMFFSQSRGDAQWGDSESLRETVAATGAQFRTFRAIEPEIDEFGYRRFVADHGTPCIVVVDTDKKVMFARKLASLEDAIRAVKEMR